MSVVYCLTWTAFEGVLGVCFAFEGVTLGMTNCEGNEEVEVAISADHILSACNSHLFLFESTLPEMEHSTTSKQTLQHETKEVMGRGCYTYSTDQQNFLQSLIPEFQAHPKKQNEAFDHIYSLKLVHNSLFATPASLTVEEWKKLSFKSLLKWFDNNTNKKKIISASRTKITVKSDNSVFPMIDTVNDTTATSSTTFADTHDGFSWAKLCDQAKFFTDLTSARMEVRSGRGLFAASKNTDEDAVAAEWKSLSVDERNKWEQSAATSCDVPE
ncbi:hypothetical protein FB446DRAFT_708291 [Lentinula raphanica]|nr:hypothetical protein FB446DRAFT_708291 [Lentinula raphanica]